MGFGQAVSSGFSKYFVWRGRARRSEFWWWILFTIIVNFVAAIVDQLLGLHVFRVTDVANDQTSISVVYNSIGTVQAIAVLLLILPTIAVTVRRLHDTNHSGWWWWLQLLNFICFIGTIILIFAFYIKESDPSDNAYGPPPG